MKYLLDTNVFIDLLRNGNESIKDRLASVGINECCISDITQYELMVGALYSTNPEEETERIDKICEMFKILRHSDYVKASVRQKEYLKGIGKMIPDFDIFIGTAAVENGLIIISGDKHMDCLKNAVVEDWRQL